MQVKKEINLFLDAFYLPRNILYINRFKLKENLKSPTKLEKTRDLLIKIYFLTSYSSFPGSEDCFFFFFRIVTESAKIECRAFHK